MLIMAATHLYQVCLQLSFIYSFYYDNDNKAIRDGKYLAPPHASAWQRSPH